VSARSLGKENEVSKVRFTYPLATVSSATINRLTRLLAKVQEEFPGTFYVESRQLDVDGVSAWLTDAVTYLLQEWGEEPGSRELVRMIAEN
jgi:hypothetical protein